MTNPANASQPVRVRFAPSPTGFLHVGGARTALFNWLYAKKTGGTFILRIEDTDEARSTDASTDQILESMKWLGLDWDEGPFFQSQRWDIYEEHLKKLHEGGWIYPAFETAEELEAMRKAAMDAKENPIYNRAALKLSPEEVQAKIAAGESYVWRFKCPAGKITVPETLMTGGSAGNVVDSEELGDFVVTRATTGGGFGKPLYNLVCAVDDALMGITNVIRGVEHLSNAPRQMLLMQAWGYDVPSFTHLPLIMKNGKKMSKRDGDADKLFPVSVSARRDLGYLPEATVNFIALLGWSMDRENDLLTREDLIANFSLDGLSKANANFDEDKYLYINGWYIRNMPQAEIAERVKPFLEKEGLVAPERGNAWLANIIELERERCKLLSEFPEALRYFFIAPATYEEKGVKKLFEKDGVTELLDRTAAILAETHPFDAEHLEGALRAVAEEKGVGFGKVAQPIRLAVTGRMASPGLFEVLIALGKDECLARIRTAISHIQSSEGVPVA
ncbi:MAG: glutamate--tRNA ligase [Sumerlaeia bacterium]